MQFSIWAVVVAVVSLFGLGFFAGTWWKSVRISREREENMGMAESARRKE